MWHVVLERRRYHIGWYWNGGDITLVQFACCPAGNVRRHHMNFRAMGVQWPWWTAPWLILLFFHVYKFYRLYSGNELWMQRTNMTKLCFPMSLRYGWVRFHTNASSCWWQESGQAASGLKQPYVRWWIFTLRLRFMVSQNRWKASAIGYWNEMMNRLRLQMQCLVF